MTREEYREHLCSIIYMVFTAEHNVLEQRPELLEHLKKERSPKAADDYVHNIADEILSNTPDALIPNEDYEEWQEGAEKAKDVPHNEKNLTTCSKARYTEK